MNFFEIMHDILTMGSIVSILGKGSFLFVFVVVVFLLNIYTQNCLTKLTICEMWLTCNQKVNFPYRCSYIYLIWPILLLLHFMPSPSVYSLRSI